MRQVILLRTAAVTELLFALGHLSGGLKQWSPMGGNPVLDEMTSVRFDVMGASRSYLDFYMGFGWSLGVLMLMQAVLLWQLGSMVRTNARQTQAMLAVITIANLVSALLTLDFFFLVPALFSLVLIAVLVAAWIDVSRLARRQ
jgi:hypothetical protein